MDIDFTRWLPAAAIRHSRRQYNQTEPISEEILNSLRLTCTDFRPYPEARVELITETPGRIFNFILGSYGFIRNPVAALAFIGDMRQPHVQEATGYTGEGIILEATALGLGTCWVAGFFSPAAAGRRANLAVYERVLAVSPLGYPSLDKTVQEKAIMGFAHNRKRKPLADLVTGLPENKWPTWLKPALEAARIAPSATNRQPWRFDVQAGSVTVSTDPGGMDFKVSKRLDCGIAMLHIEIAALNQGIKGHWELLEGPQVARLKF
jgi:hypothetical protein